MAYDEELAARVRAVVDDRPSIAAEITERKMFGGLAFLVHGKMAVAVSGRGGLMVRTDPADTKRLLASTDGAERMDMNGRTMRGWILVPVSRLAHEDALAGWVDVGLAAARSVVPNVR